MDTAHLEGLIGMLTVLGILVLVVLPSLLGIAHDRRMDRQIRKAQQARRRYFTTTVTHHS
ncbi:hypothetical protein ACQEWB_32880 [Streptomyces sp. CA-249302]|uniref:hypothetical protein n=1 Tax=Streptomyces sp. CA-249302 TaxID=3240058 RepID=UPI003D8DD71E